jgi:phosphoglycolate phosphatase
MKAADRPRVYVFDWDGTLIDSVARIVGCLRSAARDLHLEVLADAQYGDVIGLGLPEAIRQLYPELDAVAANAYRDRYAARFIDADVHPCAFFPGAIETLEELRLGGHHIAVATGKSRRGLDRALRAAGLEGFFDVTRCADETASKPDPRMLHEILAELGACAAEALMIGDTEYDMDMAKRAGITAVGVSFGVHSPVRLARHGPMRIIDSLPELCAWWPVSAVENGQPQIAEEFGEPDQRQPLEGGRVLQFEGTE